MSYTFASATILLLLITDPLGNIPIFANALRGVAPERRARVILREVLIAFALLLVFLFFGAQFLRVMNLSDLSLQIAGAVVLLSGCPRLLRHCKAVRLSVMFGTGTRGVRRKNQALTARPGRQWPGHSPSRQNRTSRPWRQKQYRSGAESSHARAHC